MTSRCIELVLFKVLIWEQFWFREKKIQISKISHTKLALTSSFSKLMIKNVILHSPYDS